MKDKSLSLTGRMVYWVSCLLMPTRQTVPLLLLLGTGIQYCSFRPEQTDKKQVLGRRQTERLPQDGEPCCTRSCHSPVISRTEGIISAG